MTEHDIVLHGVPLNAKWNQSAKTFDVCRLIFSLRVTEACTYPFSIVQTACLNQHTGTKMY